MTMSKNLEQVVNMENKILVTGAAGAIGRRLLLLLREQYGNDLVVAGWNTTELKGSLASGPMEKVNVVDKDALEATIKQYNIGTVYHLAAKLSVAAEEDPELAEKVNVTGFTNVLELAGKHNLKVFWPSSIAVYGPGAPKDNTPQDAALNPITGYGKAKVIGEQQGETYFNKYGVDFRSVRLPGINDRLEEGEKPGPGTTEYVMDMIYAIKNNMPYECPLDENTMLPMMDMNDAVEAIKQIMAAPKEQIKIRTSYNIDSISFTPRQLEDEIRKFVGKPGSNMDISNFKVSYKPDVSDEPGVLKRQNIANSWPHSIDGSKATKDWECKELQYNLPKMVERMLS